MYRHILIPTDGSRCSEEAAQAALRLARIVGARVTALHVVCEIDEPPLEGWAHGDRRFPEKLGRALERRASAYLEAVQDAARCAGVPCDCAIAVGASPAGAIVREARERGCDLVVMGSHGHRGTGGLAASETLKVVAMAAIPVLTYQPARVAAAAADADGGRHRDAVAGRAGPLTT
jgi:nucleotide-binding universal stress UspA family protein